MWSVTISGADLAAWCIARMPARPGRPSVPTPALVYATVGSASCQVCARDTRTTCGWLSIMPSARCSCTVCMSLSGGAACSSTLHNGPSADRLTYSMLAPSSPASTLSRAANCVGGSSSAAHSSTAAKKSSIAANGFASASAMVPETANGSVSTEACRACRPRLRLPSSPTPASRLMPHADARRAWLRSTTFVPTHRSSAAARTRRGRTMPARSSSCGALDASSACSTFSLHM